MMSPTHITSVSQSPENNLEPKQLKVLDLLLLLWDAWSKALECVDDTGQRVILRFRLWFLLELIISQVLHELRHYVLAQHKHYEPGSWDIIHITLCIALQTVYIKLTVSTNKNTNICNYYFSPVMSNKPIFLHLPQVWPCTWNLNLPAWKLLQHTFYRLDRLSVTSIKKL